MAGSLTAAVMATAIALPRGHGSLTAVGASRSRALAFRRASIVERPLHRRRSGGLTMKKHKLDGRKLDLGRETLLPLQRDALIEVAGGGLADREQPDTRGLTFVRYCGTQE
jgi:hypothetical protein